MCSRNIFIGLFSLILIQFSVQDSLRAVQIAFRHGDRNPIKPYPNDIYKNESYWPEGWAELTYRGKRRMYDVGKYIKQRYPKINRGHVVIYSSETNRSIQSGMAAIAGFLDQKVSILDRLKLMSPSTYGVHIIPKIDDKTIIIGQKCSKYTELYFDFFEKSNVMKKFYKENKQFFDIFNRYTGMNFKYLSIDMLTIADTLLIQKSRNLELPEWADHLYESGQLQKIRDSIFPYLSYTKEMKRLRGGYLLKTLIENMESVIESLTTYGHPGHTQTSANFVPQLTIHSGHDVTVANWLLLLGVYEGNYGIPYGSTVFLELHESEYYKEEYFVQIFYKNDTESGPIHLQMHQCPHPCNFEHFKILMEPLMVHNREEECKLDDNSSASSKHLNLSVVTFMVFLCLCFSS